MADVILDQPEESEIRKLYGANWRKSTLIEGAYESEGFFPGLGKEGKWCWFTAAPIKDSDGLTIGAIETLWDRTEQKKAEEEKERHYTDIAGLCCIYTALNTSLDLDLRINAAIEEMQNLLGTDGICFFLRKPNGQFELRYNYDITQETCEIISAFHRDSVIDQVAAGGRVTIYENLIDQHTLQNGLLETGIKSLAYIPISTEAKNVIGVIRLASKQANHFTTEGQNILDLIGNRIGEAIENSLLHQKFIRSEEKYRSLFNNDPNPIFIVDSQTLRILDINRRAEDSYGYTRQELLDKSFLDLGDANDEELMTGLKSLTVDQSILFSKKRHFNKDGLPIYVNINVCYATYRQNDVLIANTTDISETVEKETQLIQASKMNTLGQMAAGIAHEINQPLNVIQVCADYFLKTIQKGERISDEEVKTLAADISGNVQRAAGIIKHMRDFSRQSESVRSRVNLNDPIRDIFKVMQHQIEIHNIEIELDLVPDLPDILAEHNRLEQVFINLVTNAIDAMDEKCRQPGNQNSPKRLTLKTYFAAGRVFAEVADTGIGMSPEIIDKLFEPFFTTKEVGKGTGLGVSISYGIVKDYAGLIDVTSQIGEGTTFTLTFPAIDR
jgi:PAS domain S-box-containing protein